MIETVKVPGYTNGVCRVYDCIAFFTDSHCLFIRPTTGTALAMYRTEAESILRREPSDELLFLMVQRGLADYGESRKPVETVQTVFPTFFLIDFTKHCNLSCIYCFRELSPKHPRLTGEKLKKICQALVRYGAGMPDVPLHVQVWGGEPLLELPLIRKMCGIFREAGTHIQITMETNATLITPEIADILHDNQIELGISIDGNAVVHDLQRPLADGKGSLHLVEQGIENLRNAGYTGFGTITVVTFHTVAHLGEILAYFTETLALRSVKFNLMRKNERNHGLALSIEEIDTYIERLLAELKILYRRDVPLVEQNIAQRLKNLVYRPENNICNACGCCGGYRMLSIDSDGGIYPCELTDYPQCRIGQIGEGEFPEMVQRALAAQNPYFARRNLSECTDCPWYYYCRGGCRSAAFYAGGSFTEPDRTECAFNKALYPRLAEILLTDQGFAQYLMNGEV